MPRTVGHWSLSLHSLLFALAVGVGLPARLAAAPEGRLGALRETLQRGRQAHLERDAARLASGIADSLVTIDNGRISWTTRTEVQQYFESYFRGATYHAWDDLEPPVLRLSEDGTMAWVSRRVTVDREEPAPEGRRRRRFVSALSPLGLPPTRMPGTAGG